MVCEIYPLFATCGLWIENNWFEVLYLLFSVIESYLALYVAFHIFMVWKLLITLRTKSYSKPLDVYGVKLFLNSIARYLATSENPTTIFCRWHQNSVAILPISTTNFVVIWTFFVVSPIGYIYAGSENNCSSFTWSWISFAFHGKPSQFFAKNSAPFSLFRPV